MVNDLAIINFSEILGFYYWTKNKITEKELWSPEVHKIIGQNQPLNTFDKFVRDHIHENDQHPLLEKITNYLKKKTDFEIDIRIRKEDGDYYWLCSKSATLINDTVCPEEHLIIFMDINDRKKYKIRYEENKFFYQESAEMTRTGGWFIDFEHKKTYWDRGTRKILEIDKSEKPSIKAGISFFNKDYRYKILKHLIDCSVNGFPFHIETKLNTSKGRSFWAIIIGKPIYNEVNTIIGIRGVIQDIYELKMKELSIKKSMDIITSQNARLFNFAHIVSHNLRSHSSNIELINVLIKDAEDEKEKDELFKTLLDISENLNTTIEHLNEVAAIHTLIDKKMQKVRFSNALAQVCTSINQIITTEDAHIETDFAAVDEIFYVPAYLESILLNLITNAIKYRHEERSPKIYIKTYKKEEKVCMTVKDNGVGIDLEMFGDKVFGMYNTFHQREGAVGIGLFLTKNQIESLNGTISIESEVDLGTTFTINF